MFTLGRAGEEVPTPQPAGISETVLVGPPWRSLRVLTWNVLAPSPWESFIDAIGLASPGEQRARGLIEAIKIVGADIVALQEVTGGFMAVLEEDPDWTVYHTTANGREDPPGGLLVLSRYPFSKIAYRKLPSALGRYALFATTTFGERQLVVANVHLESLLEAHASRVAQLEFVNRRLPHGGLAVWLGDFNFGDEDQESDLAVLSSWDDVWTQLRPSDAGYTYDLAENRLAKNNAFTAESSRRLDRILVSGRLRPVDVGLTGRTLDQAVSDHSGVWADLEPSPP